MKRLILGFAFACVLPAADSLTVAQRNDACFALRGDRSEATLRAMRAELGIPAVRACAGRNLREAGAEGELTDALGDADPEVRAAAARELGELQSPRAIESLGRAAEDTNAMVAESAVQALCMYDDPRVLPILLRRAERPDLAGITAFTRAVRFRDPAVLRMARELLASAQPATQIIALGALGELGDASDLPRLREMAARHEPLVTRGRGFGFMPPIDIGRAAGNATASIILRLQEGAPMRINAPAPPRSSPVPRTR